MIRRILPLAMLLVASAAPALSQPATIRVATYNVLNFSGNEGTNAWHRIGDFRTVLSRIDPDILLVQEMVNPSGAQVFLDSVMSFRANYAAFGTEYLDGCDEALFIDTARVEFLRAVVHDRALRDIIEYVLVIRQSNDTLHAFDAHLKAGDASADAEQRTTEVDPLHDEMGSIPFGDYYLLAGDLNVYTSDEAAYQSLTSGTNGGRFTDPIDRPGDWHNHSEFADIFTQSPRTRQFDGGINGGMDDRFDFILVSPELRARFLSGSYTAFGNDGHHMNDSINQMPNDAVDLTTANALHYASDHIPVYADFAFDSRFSGVAAASSNDRMRVAPLPASGVVRIGDATLRAISLIDLNGRTVRRVSASGGRIRLDVSDLPSGLYEIRATDRDGTVRRLTLPVVH